MESIPPVENTDIATRFAQFKHETHLRDRLVSGIYCLYDNGQLVYIGQSYNILGRLAQHRRAKQYTFTDATFLPIYDEGERLRWEGIFILFYHPPGNRAIYLGLRDGKVWEIGYKRKKTTPTARAAKGSARTRSRQG